MNTSPEEICNKALRDIGAQTIRSLDQGGHVADACKTSWKFIRPFVFRLAPWHCIAKRVELTEQTTAPAWGYSAAYVLPADYLRMIQMADHRTSFRDVGGRLHTNASPAQIEYVYDCLDCTKYSADLVRSLELNIAYDVAMALTQDTKLMDKIKTDLERFFLPLVKYTNAIEGGPVVMQSTTFTDLYRSRRHTDLSRLGSTS